ncbi:hypothetical protein BGZ73_008739 [Actinomortierella ambigua]|nr:hypothetical protein BGZ73_008739 [Actinomortierella ambigua]
MPSPSGPIHSSHSHLQTLRPGPPRAFQLPEIISRLLVYCLHTSEELYLPLFVQEKDQHNAPPLQLKYLSPPRPKLRRPKEPQPDLYRAYRSWWYPLLVCKQWYVLGSRLRCQRAVWSDIPYPCHRTPAPPVVSSSGLQLQLNFGPKPSGLRGIRTRSKAFVSMLVEVSDLCEAADSDACDSSFPGNSGEYLCDILKYGNDAQCHWLLRPPIVGPISVVELSMQRIPYAHYVTFVLDALGANLTMVELQFARPTLLDHEFLLRRIGTTTTNTFDPTGSSALPFLHQLRHLSLSNVILPDLPEGGWEFNGWSRLRTLRLCDVFADYPTLHGFLLGLCNKHLEALHVGQCTLPRRSRSTHDPMRLWATWGMKAISAVIPQLLTLTTRWPDIPTTKVLTWITTDVFPRARMVRMENPDLNLSVIREYRPSSWSSSSPMSHIKKQDERLKQQPWKLTIVKYAVETSLASRVWPKEPQE